MALLAEVTDAILKKRPAVNTLDSLLRQGGSSDSLNDLIAQAGRANQQNSQLMALRPLISQALGDARSSFGGGGRVIGPNVQAFQAALRRLVADSGGRVSLGPLSRSYEEQVRLYNQAVKKYGKNARKWAAYPGKSKHGSGLANDLRYANAAARQWVHQNASRYGLWFPMAHEPWHIEPRGSR